MKKEQLKKLREVKLKHLFTDEELGKLSMAGINGAKAGEDLRNLLLKLKDK